ncbi:acyl-coenzyme A thioesterase 9, mitochondrial isoform X1 [Drosophila teissieri]|uniref:acyl-coenzyme A thioesterase 9, mitochondrial isoform X1 n=2 Tax=Drosophila teissieri TaxID=7243 RepID=UPI001CBA412A|nr:acyl-coenzyme A thioesterase 9, mitochondrial isoform X1 [Drosophila teissieri]
MSPGLKFIDFSSMPVLLGARSCRRFLRTRMLRKMTIKHYSSNRRSDPPDNQYSTIAEIKEKMMKSFGLEPGYTTEPKSREELLKYQPKFEDLPARSMQDSFSSAIIPLSTDAVLQDKYINFRGFARLGRLLEDMDLFAAWCCHRHLKVPNLPEGVPLPYSIVTVLVDRIDFTSVSPNGTQDIRLSGHVSWVGSSSMEVVVWLEQVVNEEYQKITRALFLMAARNATNTAAAPVNPIQPANEEEKVILAGGADRKKQRQILSAQSVFKVEPNAEEQSLIYQLYKRTTPVEQTGQQRLLPPNCIWMHDSFQMSTIPSFPEHRNQNNTVFGGFLMRSALEISWATAFLYCKTRPKLEHISDVSFHKPVSVNSFIKMTAYVVYTKENYLQIMTVAEVLDAYTGSRVTTNAFHYTFSAPDPVTEVLPRSYHDTMWYINGRRKFKASRG